jgi:hypothetical protein
MLKNTRLLVAVFLLLTHLSFSQKIDTIKNIHHFSGSFSVTNNGISLIPTFSLGKPATIVSLSMGKGKLSFEPELRFALEGKPWSFLFWWRYNLLNTGKFGIKIGAHPALNFKTSAVTLNGTVKDIITTRRYLAAELSPNYYLSNRISIGVYYLYSRGIDKDATRNTHFLTVNGNFSNIRLNSRFFMKLIPQFYFLKQDKEHGVYFTTALSLAKRNFPLSISAIINKTIKTDISASKNFVWNATLVYSFNKKYIKM